MFREICVENAKNIEMAVQKGIDRIELCDNLAVGGTTVSYGVMKMALELANGVSVFPLIRPRSGNFFYTDREVESMCDDIRLAKTLGVQGVVLGALTKDLQVDQVAMKKMLKEAGNLEKTFHMAIDEAADWKEVAKFCLDNGIQRVLTHGGPMSESVFLHVERLQEMERYHRDLTVVIGGGVRYDNVERLASFFTKAQFHGTKIISIGIKENI